MIKEELVVGQGEEGIFINYKFYLDSIMENLAEGIIVVDKEARIILFNEPVTDLVGVSPPDAIGKNILDVFPQLTEKTSVFYQVLEQQQKIINHIQTYTNIKGQEVTIVTSVIPLKEKGKVVGALEVFRDFTKVHELSEKVLDLQQRFSNPKRERKHNCNGTIYKFEDIISNSVEMNNLINKAKKAACSSSPILIYGETGTGKELLVQSIHNSDKKRCKNPFIAQNCAAIPNGLLESILFGATAGSYTGAKDRPGLFELAHGGTLFLDEINSMDIELQGKLLRVLEDGIVRRVGGTKTELVDVRIIAATNEEPQKSVENKALREDLFYRLDVVSLEIPPLRSRKNEIPILIEYFIDLYNEKLGTNVKGISNEANDHFMRYHWKGNVRELKYTIEGILNLIGDKEIIQIDNLPQKLIAHPLTQAKDCKPNIDDQALRPLNATLRDYEISLIKKAIKKANGNYAQAARLLDIPRQTLHNKIKKYNITWTAELNE